MEEQVLETLSQMGAQLALLTAKGTAVQVNNKVQAIRNKKQIDELCNSYEEVINELVAERAQAIALANAYQAELNRYEITDEDILHLQATIENALNIQSSVQWELTAGRHRLLGTPYGQRGEARTA